MSDSELYAVIEQRNKLLAQLQASELRIKELEAAMVEAKRDADQMVKQNLAANRAFSLYKNKSDQLEDDCAVLRQAIGDFVNNVKHSHVAGWGDVSRDTVADSSFKELIKAAEIRKRNP